MAAINYRGNLMNELYKAMELDPDMTVGEVLYSFLHKSRLKGKHFFYATDEEIYNSLESLNKVGEDEDEPLTENAFNFWVEQVSGKIIKEK